MRKLAEVEQATALLAVAKDWSIIRWLAEKRRVRAIADKGTAALDEAERQVKASWSEELHGAYLALTPASSDGDDPFADSEREYLRQQAEVLPEHIKAIAQSVIVADEAATRARLTAESTFDEAERRLSAGLARRGAEEAIEAYRLRYLAIDAAEAAWQALQE
jgi:hypothetical protein